MKNTIWHNYKISVNQSSNGYYYVVLSLLFIAQLNFQTVHAQSDFMRPGDYGAYVIERMEIKSGRMDSIYFTGLRPYDRAFVGDFIDKYDSLDLWKSKSDQFNRTYLYRENLPYTSEDSFPKSKRNILKYFYSDPANMLSVQHKNLDLFVNPILNLEMGRELNISERNTYVNTRGIEVRGNIDGKLGFYSLVTENQVVAPAFVRQRRQDTDRFFPQEGFGKNIAGGYGYDFFDVRGYFTFRPTQSIQVSFGKDRNFIGNGMRSLILGDFHEDYLQLRISTKIWKFHYQNIFAEMIWRDQGGSFTSLPYAKKYTSMHYLSIDLFKNLRLGLFEAVVYSDNNQTGRGLELGYLNPIIFYRAIEHNLGDNDNMIIGGDLYYLPVKNLALYGQFIFSEFSVPQLRARNGWSGNQWGIQGGMRYIDALGLKNVDLLAEVNVVRPYVYGHRFPGNTFNHFGQPLAHPFGANFREFIGSAKMQLWPRLMVDASLIYNQQGRDPDNSTNWGGDIRKNSHEPEQRFGNFITQGELTTVFLARMNLSYQLAHNLFFEATAQQRLVASQIESLEYNDLWLSGGMRWNIGKRNFQF
ncbi:MAG: hypothetical protein LAT68_04510 [Cyclobacteriaceae bacterium]|nr:hypothetical protein [Cyclobacteriaceae bacterium]MCH8515572.1 hypothetical protein [Cyclobacteriaceae bacterium]